MLLDRGRRKREGRRRWGERGRWWGWVESERERERGILGMTISHVGR